MFKPDYFIQPLGAGSFGVYRARWFSADLVYTGQYGDCDRKLKELRR